MSVRQPESRPRPIGCAGCHRRGERLTLFVNGKSYCANCAVLVREGLHIDPANPKALQEIEDAAERAAAGAVATTKPGAAAKNGAAGTSEPADASKPTDASQPTDVAAEARSDVAPDDSSDPETPPASAARAEAEAEASSVEPTAAVESPADSPAQDAIEEPAPSATPDTPPPSETEQNEAEPEAPAAQAEPSAPEQQEETVPEQASAEAPRRVRASARASESLIAALSEERERLIGRRAALEAKIQDIEEQIEGVGARLVHVEVLLAEEDGAAEAAA